MYLNPKKLNSYLILKLPSAWLCGVRVEELNATTCSTRVRHRWINQNPFGSLYFAVQAMAAELSTGALVMAGVRQSGKSISMLVAENQGKFLKKATGTVHFHCEMGQEVLENIRRTIETEESQVFWMSSRGIDEHGILVSEFRFRWTLKLRTK